MTIEICCGTCAPKGFATAPEMDESFNAGPIVGMLAEFHHATTGHDDITAVGERTTVKLEASLSGFVVHMHSKNSDAVDNGQEPTK